jgi:hypothetical protein
MALRLMTLRIATLRIMTLRIMTFGIKRPSIITLRTMTLWITRASLTLRIMTLRIMTLKIMTHKIMTLSCKIFEHFGLQVDPVIEFIQPGSTPFKDSTILVPKLANPSFWWNSNSTPYKTGSSLPDLD